MGTNNKAILKWIKQYEIQCSWSYYSAVYKLNTRVYSTSYLCIPIKTGIIKWINTVGPLNKEGLFKGCLVKEIVTTPLSWWISLEIRIPLHERIRKYRALKIELEKYINYYNMKRIKAKLKNESGAIPNSFTQVAKWNNEANILRINYLIHLCVTYLIALWF